MGIFLGIDVGVVGVKMAMVMPRCEYESVAQKAGDNPTFRCLTQPSGELVALVSPDRRAYGKPVDTTCEMLHDVFQVVSPDSVVAVVCTGSGGGLVSSMLGAETCNEFKAAAKGVGFLHPEVRTLFEIGGESSRYLSLEPDPQTGELGIQDYSVNGDCAAGTGAFLDQQASRLQYAIEDIGEIVAQTERAAQIAGRCSVFAKSDMIHAQQKGYNPGEVLHGLCNAVATNFKSAVVKGHRVEAPIAFVGGVSANSAVVAAIREVFGLAEEEMFVPTAAESIGAIGAALTAAGLNTTSNGLAERLNALVKGDDGASSKFERSKPLSLEKVRLLRDQETTYDLNPDKTPIDAFLGIDIGSVGTKLALIDSNGDVVHTIFTRTDGRPIEVVSRILRELEEAVGWGVNIRGVGTTGSGRELIGELVGADSVNDEITAHKTGATFIGDRLLGRRPDTIFEIGGQDSKFISLESQEGGTGTVVVDFMMNEACAAGTGSFLEERAEELGVAIKGEFAAEALKSKSPVKLGERCTVFMERDVSVCMQRGAKREDVIAGLAYSVGYNYINRVVRDRRIGDCVFFQGGTAYNDAVAAAFSMITGKEIIVPPHNAVLGAVGAALLAKEKISDTQGKTRFRGYDMSQVEYTLREFTCHGCGNQCAIQEFCVEGEKTHWGDKCSDRFRKQVKSQRKPVIDDLVQKRAELLVADDDGDPKNATKTIGIPMALYSWEYMPFWRRFFRDCGFKVVFSNETNRRTVRKGYDAVVAEPCFPIIVAHGHVAELVEANVDHIFIPNMISQQRDDPKLRNLFCPWGMTLPFVVRQSPAFRDWAGRILCPMIRFDDGIPAVQRSLVTMAKEIGVKKSVARRAFETALSAQSNFKSAYQAAGKTALDRLNATGEPGMVLVGRPYNMYDGGVSLSVARKLRESYGVNVIPIDALPLDKVDLDGINDNMYWAYGRRILGAAKIVRQHANLDIIYITNFKCGPDSYLKSFIRETSGKPFLTLQFDGHSNDAGMLTRCEAYLDSKGILRWWRNYKSMPVEKVSQDEHSLSPECPSQQPG